MTIPEVEGFNLRSLDVTESCSLDIEPVIALFGGFPYLIPDVFAFSITIGPDTQCIAMTCLLFDVFGYFLLVLQTKGEKQSEMIYI